MHQLFVEVLSRKDLSRAGELFGIDDRAIEGDLSDLLATIQRISSAPNFIERHNDQSVVEICLTRIISAIRDTDTIEEHAGALVSLLESCLLHDLKPTNKDQDPPHAKIASEVVSCIFLNHSKKSVMCLAVPVAVKLLHRGNKELSRNLSSYLSLAAINNADILAAHIQPIMDSIISGNYSLVRVLPKIYVVNRDPIHDHIMALVCLLPRCDTSERSSLLNLFASISKNKPSILEYNLPQLNDCLRHPQTAYTTMQIFLDMAQHNCEPFVDYINKVIAACEIQSSMVSIAAEFLGIVGKLNVDKAKDVVRFMTIQLSKSDLSTTITLLRQIKSIAEAFPSVLSIFMPSIQSQTENSTSSTVQSYLQQLNSINALNSSLRSSATSDYSFGAQQPHQQNRSTSHLMTTTATVGAASALVSNVNGSISIKSAGGGGGGGTSSFLASSDISPNSGIISQCSSQPPPSISTSGSTAKVSSGSKFGGMHLLHRSIPRLHVVSGSAQISGPHHSTSAMHRSLTALVASNNHGSSGGGSSAGTTTSSRQRSMNRMSVESVSTTNTNPSSSQKSASSSYLLALQEKELSTSSAKCCSAGDKNHVTGSSIDSQLQHSSTVHHNHHNVTSSSSSSSHYNLRNSKNEINYGNFNSHSSSKRERMQLNAATSTLSSGESSYSVSGAAAAVEGCSNSIGGGSGSSQGSGGGSGGRNAADNRVSVFEPYPMRDAVQHFCEKHIDKIKTYMQKVFVKIPLPRKCTIEERKSKKMAKIYFSCHVNGEHCLYQKTHFVMKTKNARIWIHLMFLALQARAKSALCTREPSVNALKNCWETLKLDNRTFLTLVTSSFPSAKDQEVLIDELRAYRYFDVFKFNALLQMWGCFLCNHPDKATGFLKNSEPVIEGQLKEKKGKWKIFRRWRTRYFTLSGIHLYRDESGDKDSQPVEVGKVQSVRAVGNTRGGRTIPKAFEIFTNDKTYILKAKNTHNNQEWMQCLSIAMAHSQAKEK